MHSFMPSVKHGARPEVAPWKFSSAIKPSCAPFMSHRCSGEMSSWMLHQESLLPKPKTISKQGCGQKNLLGTYSLTLQRPRGQVLHIRQPFPTWHSHFGSKHWIILLFFLFAQIMYLRDVLKKPFPSHPSPFSLCQAWKQQVHDDREGVWTSPGDLLPLHFVQ